MIHDHYDTAQAELDLICNIAGARAQFEGVKNAVESFKKVRGAQKKRALEKMGRYAPGTPVYEKYARQAAAAASAALPHDLMRSLESCATGRGYRRFLGSDYAATACHVDYQKIRKEAALYLESLLALAG